MVLKYYIATANFCYIFYVTQDSYVVWLWAKLFKTGITMYECVKNVFTFNLASQWKASTFFLGLNTMLS